MCQSLQCKGPAGSAVTGLQAVLVNKETASSSEMLASALRKRGASVIGTTTKGKGRSQADFPLPDRSLLLLSVLTFTGAVGEQIDGAGLTPKTLCEPEVVEEARYESGEVADGGSLLDDPCVALAVEAFRKSAH